MKRKTISLVLGGLILLGAAVSLRAETMFQNKELDQFFQAKASVFTGDWAGVRSGMEAYLKDFPAGKMRDEALFWLAKSLDRLSRDARDVFTAVDLKRKAFDSFDRLVKGFPDSLWRDDAKEAQIEIAGALAVLGQDEQRIFLEDAVRTNAANGVEIKKAALNSIIALDPKAAIPVLRKFLAAEGAAALRLLAVRLMSEKYPNEALPVLEEVVKSDSDPDVRKEAASRLDKARMRLIPVKVGYFCYATRVTDTSVYAKVPEGKVAVFTVPHGQTGKEARIKKAIERIFDGQIEFSGSKATMNSEALELMGASRITHTIAGIKIEMIAASIMKTESEISGRVRFGDMDASFKVDKASDVILAARRGDQQAVMYLEMSPKDISEELKKSVLEDMSSSSTKARPASPNRKPIYPSQYNMSGMVVYSTRNSTDPEAFRANLFDFGEAKAEIPGPGGTWTLTGQLLLLNKEQRLVGRMAKLVRPDGSTAAAGEEIRVPIKNPEKFEAGTGADAKSPSTFALDGGGRILSAGMKSNSSADLLDFGTTQAILPGPRGNWTLTGYLILVKPTPQIMAYKAVLKDPEGKTVAEGELLFVPVKNPDQYRLAVERIK